MNDLQEPQEMSLPEASHNGESNDDDGGRDDDHFMDEDGLMDSYSNNRTADLPAEEAATESPSIAEPKYDRANRQPFYKLCSRLEDLARLSRRENVKRVPTAREKLERLLPKDLIQWIHPQSMYPMLRLLMPDRDSARKTQTKERSLAKAYCEAFHFEPRSAVAQKLYDFKNPSIASEEAGDFSNVLFSVLKNRVSSQPSKLTIGDINKLLDELSNRLAGNYSTNHDWRASQQHDPQQAGGNKPAKKKPVKVRENWVCKLVAKNLSALEHKWLARILLEELKIGIGWEKLIQWCYDFHGTNEWKMHNSLKAVCNKLCDPEYIQKRNAELKTVQQEKEKQRFSELFASSTTDYSVEIDNTISPMKSEKTSFESFMTNIGDKHRKALKQIKDKDDPAKHALALKFPTFISEVKLDGERMVVHIHRGIVTMHTRQGKWYSECYSPVLGPALRRAISKFDVDCILDGEVIAWDDARKECVPFGSNRTIALLRSKWMAASGKVDKRDFGLHRGDGDKDVVRRTDILKFEKPMDDEEHEAGAECWLKYVAFDVMYIGGPDAAQFLKETFCPGPCPATEGSLIILDGFERKRILYRLLEEQENEVEIAQSVVVTSSGKQVKAREYFSPSQPYMECSIPGYTLDSPKWTLNVVPQSTLKGIDEKRRDGRKDIEISRRRTDAVNQFYTEIVDRQKQEGVMFKDLSASYVLRSKTGTWLKIKPDYSNNSFASDLDVIIIGGSFATGLRRAGELSSFLCGCVDSDDPKKYFTFCRINAKSLNEDKLEVIMKHTGFEKATADKPVTYGKWFRERKHGITSPDFLSQRSFQRGQEGRGWRFDRVKNYPDLWIHPENSVVLTVNASEIVPSDEYSAGLSLRFPRATRLRLGEDAKPPSEVEDEDTLYRLFREYRETMQANSADASLADYVPNSPSKLTSRNDTNFVRRFQTVEEYMNNKKIAKRRQKRIAFGAADNLINVTRQSTSLEGADFFVLEGTYCFDPHSIDAEEARKEGWFAEASSVRDAQSVKAFVLKHGGTVSIAAGPDSFIVGGHEDDPRVAQILRGEEKRFAKKAKKAKNPTIGFDESSGGILRWTFVVSIVHRFLSSIRGEGGYHSDASDGEEAHSGMSILSTKPEMLLEPKIFDYLARPHLNEDDLDCIVEMGELDLIGFKRAMEFVGARRGLSKRPRVRNDGASWAIAAPFWQYAALNYLPEDSRWACSCDHEYLWPYSRNTRTETAVILFPDLFEDGFGVESHDEAFNETLSGTPSKRWEAMAPNLQFSSIASSLPLLRAMGSLLSAHLSDGVTHVLCDLTVESTLWRPGVPLEVTKIFRDPGRGQMIIERLQHVKAGRVSNSVLLVSPLWVNSIWGA